MSRTIFKKTAALLGVFIAIWVVIRYLLPIFMPFLLGAALALAAEPVVNFLQTRLRLPRAAAAGIGVSLAFAILVLVALTLGALLFRELSGLAGSLPQAREMVQQGLTALQDWLMNLSNRAPEGIASLLTRLVTELFSGGAQLLSKATDWILGLAAGILSRIPDGALGFGTGLIASYMISAKLPRIRAWVQARIPDSFRSRILPALQTVRTTVWHWLRAQFRLAGVTCLILTAGLLILRVRYAPLWALLISLVDAVPVLGTGTVLIPWAAVCLLEGDHARCIGLVAIYIVAVISRSVLEPKLVGRQMGIDPLVTLLSFYFGYQLWGVLGMLLAPMITAAAIRLTEASSGQRK